jgi:hypothetical protein
VVGAVPGGMNPQQAIVARAGALLRRSGQTRLVVAMLPTVLNAVNASQLSG